MLHAVDDEQLEAKKKGDTSASCQLLLKGGQPHELSNPSIQFQQIKTGQSNLYHILGWQL